MVKKTKSLKTAKKDSGKNEKKLPDKKKKKSNTALYAIAAAALIAGMVLTAYTQGMFGTGSSDTPGENAETTNEAVIRADSETSTSSEEPFGKTQAQYTFVNGIRGLCMIIQSNGENAMIGSGDVSDAEKILSELKNKKIDHLKYLIIPDFEDAMTGSADAVLENCTVDTVVSGRLEKGENEDAGLPDVMLLLKNIAYDNQMKTEFISVASGEALAVGNAQLNFLSPIFSSSGDSLLSSNAVVTRIVCGDQTLIVDSSESDDDMREIANHINAGNKKIKSNILYACDAGDKQKNTQVIESVSPETVIVNDNSSVSSSGEEPMAKTAFLAGCSVINMSNEGEELSVVTDGKRWQKA